jgi:hypothetical protein
MLKGLEKAMSIDMAISLLAAQPLVLSPGGLVAGMYVLVSAVSHSHWLTASIALLALLAWGAIDWLSWKVIVWKFPRR